MNLHIKLYTTQLLAMSLCTYLLLKTDLGFTYSLIPLCFAFSAPFFAPIKYVLIDHRKKSNWIEKTLAVIFITAIIHHFNMAFFRLDPNAEAWGWALAIAQYQCMSILLPLMINHKREENERENLKLAVGKISGYEILEEQTQELYKQLQIQLSQKIKIQEDLQLSNTQLKEERDTTEILIRTISHDLANPLTAISAYIDILNKNSLTPEVEERIWGFLINNKETALDMIKRIRDAIVTRSQAELVTVTSIPLNKSLANAIQMFDARLKEKNLKIILKSTIPPDCLVLADENALTEHVFANILSNAIKFSYPSSEININLSETANLVKIQFRDFGTGINENRIEKRILLSTPGTNGETGTGYGLMVMGHFLRQFGAKMEMISHTEGELRGTLITLLIKQAEMNAEQSPP